MFNYKALLLFLLIGYIANANVVRIENGIVTENDTLRFRYSESGDKIQTLVFAGSSFSKMLTPEDMQLPFKDITYYSIDGEPLVYLTARVLSSPQFVRLLYYYKIDFAGLDTSVCVPYHPDLTDDVVMALLNRHAITGNILDKNAVYKMIAIWNRKPNAIPDIAFQYASTCNYNTSPYSIEPDKYTNSQYIHIKDNLIYVNDTLFARFRLSNNLLAPALPGNSKNSYYYYIETLSGTPIAEFQVLKYYADVLFWPNGYKRPISLYTAVRDEQRLVWEVVNCVLNEKQRKHAANNNK